MKPEWRRILKLRSVKDKIAVAVDCELLPVGDLPIIADLVREGVIEWIDRATLPHLVQIGPDMRRVGAVIADIYRLTPKGIELCDSNGISQQ